MKSDEDILEMELKKRLFPKLNPWDNHDESIDKHDYINILSERIPGQNSFMERNSNQNDNIPAGYTYLGQLIAHDISFEPSTLSEHTRFSLNIQNIRSPRLDLDSIYGNDPVSDLIYYDQTINLGCTHFLVDKTKSIIYKNKPELSYDLPRKVQSKDLEIAIIPDSRNDENLIISQLHLALLLFHNKIAEKKCKEFNSFFAKIDSYFKRLKRKYDGIGEDNIIDKPYSFFRNEKVLLDKMSTSMYNKRINTRFKALENNMNKLEFASYELKKEIKYLLRRINFWKLETRESFDKDQNLYIDELILYYENEEYLKVSEFFTNNFFMFSNILDTIVEVEILKRVKKISEDIIKIQVRLKKKLRKFSLELDLIKKIYYEKIFYETKKIVSWHFQWIVIFDYLRKVAGSKIVHEILAFDPYEKVKKDYKVNRKIFFWKNSPFIPIEFSTAVFRFGHSMVRDTYQLNHETTLIDVFKLKQVNKPADNYIDWSFFFEKKDQADSTATNSRGIDLFISKPMIYDLPVDNLQKNIVYRNLHRSILWSLPSGQRIASELNEIVIDDNFFKKKESSHYNLLAKQFSKKLDFQYFCSNSPLWFYILMEAHLLEHGEHLGPVGGRIVSEVLIGIIEGDKNSFLYQNPNWKPNFFDDSEVETPGDFTMVDLLNIAGVWEGAIVKENKKPC